MPARVPQDVDLEDRLVFGLSPIRFGYIVAGVVLGAATWAGHWPTPLPALAAIPVAAGLVLAVGRWRGHRLDALLWDGGLHLVRNYRVELAKDIEALLRVGRRQKAAAGTGRVLTVTALEHGVGTTTVALELAVALAMAGERVQLWEPRQETNLRLGLIGPGRHHATGLELVTGPVPPAGKPGILVQALAPGEPFEPYGQVVLVLARQQTQELPPGVLPLINRGPAEGAIYPVVPDDPHVQRAEALRESTVVAFPDAPASRAFRLLAASLAELAAT